MFSTTLSQIQAEACVPEQLPHYVQSVSGRKGFICGAYAAYMHEGHVVLVAYPGSSRTGALEAEALRVCGAGPESAGRLPDGAGLVSLEETLPELRSRGCSSLTVLSPFTPREAPDAASGRATRDCYWQLPLPAPKAGAKLRNMLLRASRDVCLQKEGWSPEHQELVDLYLRTRPLPAGTRALFSSLGAYVNGRQGKDAFTATARAADEGKVLLLAARRRDASLAGFAVGDYSALDTAFYMFAFRYPDAPPGTADFLLSGLVRHGEEMGHRRLNLGLGISDGIGFFKKKWGASPYLPYVETTWDLPGKDAQGSSGLKGLLRRLLG